MPHRESKLKRRTEAVPVIHKVLQHVVKSYKPKEVLYSCRLLATKLTVFQSSAKNCGCILRGAASFLYG